MLGLPVVPGVRAQRGGEVALPPPTAIDPAGLGELRRRYRRRRIVRRTRTGTGGLAVAAGAVASIAWTDGNLGRFAIFGGATVVLVLARLVLRRVLR